MIEKIVAKKSLRTLENCRPAGNHYKNHWLLFDHLLVTF
jgi:hypothetical protein